jgi:DNA helicase-2/ATP-dependent DNA helicase PcrA
MPRGSEHRQVRSPAADGRPDLACCRPRMKATQTAFVGVTMAWDDGLFGKQRAAAAHVGSHARLLAGPGTGKTHTLTRRVVKLVTDDGISPENILAVAFTRVNSHDLRRSVAAGLVAHDILRMPTVSTLHSYALRQLLRNSSLITSLPQPIRIADDFEEKNIIRVDIAQALGADQNQVRQKFEELSGDWQSLAVEDHQYRPADPRFIGAWQEHRAIYGYTLRSELVWQLKHALEENPDAFDLGGPTSHLLVDEYQDLNKCDLAIVQALSARGAEVFCVGDDDQSIYGFRGAHPAGIRGFLDDYKGAAPLELEICWRCDRAIIRVATHVANLDPRRLEKPMQPCDGAGEGEVHLLRFPEQVAEARSIASICRHLIDGEGYSPEDILVLLRSDHRGRYSSALQPALNGVGLEVKVRADRGTPLDEPDGRHLLSVMRLALNAHDDLPWRTLFQLVGRRNSIGAKTILALHDLATEAGLRFCDALRRVDEDPRLVGRGGLVQREVAAVCALTAQLSHLNAQVAAGPLDVSQRQALRRQLLDGLSRFAERLIESPEARHTALAYVERVAEGAEVATYEDLLAALTSPEDTLDQELDAGKVNILTMHRAKGLTAKAVIIVGAEEQLLPGDAAGNALADERRLLYVALTRAKHYLYVTFCNRRTGAQAWSGSDAGNPRRTLTPFLRGAMPVESGGAYVSSLVSS